MMGALRVDDLSLSINKKGEGTLDASRMLRLELLDADKTFKLLGYGLKLHSLVEDLIPTLEHSFLHSQIKELVETYYDIGKVTDVFEIFGGYINRSFGIYTEKEGKRYRYFVRKYKKDIEEKEIMLEHNLITCARANGLSIAAGLIPAKNGRTFVKLTEGLDDNSQDWYFAIYDFLEGEDKYTWVENECTDEEYASAAEVLAVFHNSVRNFDPQGLERVELKILDLLPTLPKLFESYAAMDIKNRFHDYYKKNLPAILNVINKIKIPAEDVAKMPLNPIHCDFHPGNLKFKDNKVVGIFDFDWSKIDLRIFEIGLALVYCCSSWVDELDGVLHLDRCEVFLQAYQKKLRELGGLPPLNETEKRYLPEMLNAGNIYLIFWCLRSYYADLSLNVYEYLAYLQHQVKCMNWVEQHRQEILDMVEAI
ncbi:MAG: Aminoglycoside phosphotransferase [Thermacetogenium phaeum]|jgi:homoserine kinase type II|uniref:Aminoglycoside phosphotransferase n=1 Tax=Thermacetogenium phaeum TaxID=85874 RepID=A0A101FFD0_9THEO|nr:MAG: Aminoglycoside phosphotransferase [Thermacetogenium phaeum]